MDKDYNFKYLSSEIKIKIIIKFTVNLLLKHYCVDVAFCAVFCIFHPLLFLFPLRFVYGNVNYRQLSVLCYLNSKKYWYLRRTLHTIWCWLLVLINCLFLWNKIHRELLIHTTIPWMSSNSFITVEVYVQYSTLPKIVSDFY